MIITKQIPFKGSKVKIIKLLSSEVCCLKLQSGKSKVSAGIIYILNSLLDRGLVSFYGVVDIREVILNMINTILKGHEIEYHLKPQGFDPADIICL